MLRVSAMRRRSRARKLTTVHNSGLVDEYRYRRTSSPSCQSRKRARICQVRAELSTIRPLFRARSASARAFAKTGGRTEQAEGGRTGPNRWAGRTGRRWADRAEPVGGPNRPKGAEPSRTAVTAEVCGTCCRGRRLDSLHSALRGNGCVATLLRDRPRGFVARRWCRARRWHRR